MQTLNRRANPERSNRLLLMSPLVPILLPRFLFLSIPVLLPARLSSPSSASLRGSTTGPFLALPGIPQTGLLTGPITGTS